MLFIFLCLALWLFLKLGYETMVLVRLLQTGAMDLTVIRDAEAQPVIPPNAKKNHRISPKELRLGKNVSFKPQTTEYQAQDGILLTSVLPKAVTVDLEI